MKKIAFPPLLAAASLLSSAAFAAPPAPPPAEMQQMMKAYSPELRQKAMALSPEFKNTLQQLHAGHPRRAKETTLRQVMHEILADYQAVAAAIATDNAEAASEAARRLANHRIPKGGLLPYFSLKHVNDTDLGVLPAMNEAVEGSALRLAEAADAGDLPKAASYLSDVMTGCVACHQKFRGVPGISANLITPVQK